MLTMIKEYNQQSIDSIETYAYGTSKDVVCRKEEITVIKQYKND